MDKSDVQGISRRELWLTLGGMAAALLLAGLCACSEPETTLRAGPMAGGGTAHSAAIWLQTTGPASAQVEYWPAAAQQERTVTPSRTLRFETHYAGRFDLNGLAPATAYEYRVLLDGEPAAQGQTFGFSTPAAWQPGETPPDFTALLGSCAWISHGAYNHPDKARFAYHRIFSTMAEQQADLMLWLGDNIYFNRNDYDTIAPSGMARRYWFSRGMPRLNRFLQSGLHYAIWDDHDYGPSNSDFRFIHKYSSLKLFKRYWANPSYGLPDARGVFTQFSFNDVDFFLLDNRFYRDPERAPDSPDKTMFGAAQMDWLKQRLLASQANFKIIAGGSGMLRDTPEGAEGWSHYPTERDDFLTWLKEHRISGILFLSGDAHFTELNQMQRPDQYPLYDLTCSPLTSPANEAIEDYRRPPMRIPGTAVGERNYCRLGFAGGQKNRRLVMSVHDVDGQRLWRRVIRLEQLQ